MMLLTTSSDLVRVNVATAATIHVYASWVDNVSGTMTPGRTNTAPISGTGDTTVVAGPSSGQRNVKNLSIRNAHASTSSVVTVEHSDGTDIQTIIKANLLPDESLIFSAHGQWAHYTKEGARYPYSSGIATQADMETATSLILAVTPGRQHFHPGHPKCWVKCDVSGGINAQYNVTSVADTGPGLATVTIANDFSGVNWCCQVSIERTSTNLTAGANQQHCAIQNAGQAAGTLVMEAWDDTATTALQADPASWHMVGLGDL